MQATIHPQVKICCISSQEEALLALKYGATALGLVGPMPSGPGIISNEMIQEIAAIIPSNVSTFLLTSETSAEAIIAHHRLVNTTTIQMVDALPEGNYEAIREALPEVQLVQVIHVRDEKSVEEAIKIAPLVDVILLDSGNPDLEVKELGGRGKVHNWNWSTKIREAIAIPLFLAGGLNSGNVKKAIEAVGPYGVDLCTGVRTNGKLDEVKLETFFKAVRGVS